MTSSTWAARAGWVSYVEAEIYAAAVEQLRAEARDLIELERTRRESVVTGLVDELARIGGEGRSVPFTGRRRIDGDAADDALGSLREDLVKVELQRRRAVVEARTHRIDLTGGADPPRPRRSWTASPRPIIACRSCAMAPSSPRCARPILRPKVRGAPGNDLCGRGRGGLSDRQN